MALVPITIAGIYEAADGSLLAGKKFEVTPEAVFGSSGVIVPSGTVKVTTDAATAAYSFTLLTTDAVDAYVRYRVRFANTDQKKRFDLTDDISPVSLDVLINAFDPSQTASSSVVWLDHEARIEALEAGGGGGGGSETATTLGVLVHGSANKAAPVDADELAVFDSAASFITKRSTFTQIKAFLKTYWDTFYQPLATVLTNTTASFTTAQETKLAGVASGATANSSDATLLARANHTGTQSADTITDGTTNKAFTATERTKLSNITITQAVDLDDIETRVNNLDAAVVLKGDWDASAGTFPGGGTAQAGFSYIVSVAGTVGGVAFSVGDRVIAILDNASTTVFASNWFKADYTDQVLSVDGTVGSVTIGAIIAAATAKTTPVDADSLALSDSAASNATKKVTWANVKATLKTYFDGIYQPLNAVLTAFAALTQTNDNFLQVKSGAWAGRTVAQVKTDLGLTGTNSGDQTTIVGITGTKAQFDTACTDGNFLYVGDVSVPSLASTTEVLTGTDTAKTATPDAIAALWEQGANIASAATLVVGEGGYFHVTGTTAITDIDPATDKAGREFDLVFDGILTLTHNASTLILPTGANITTAVGDIARFRSEGSDVVRCVNYTRASGAALTSSGGSSFDPASAVSYYTDFMNLSLWTATGANGSVSSTSGVAGHPGILLSRSSASASNNPSYAIPGTATNDFLWLPAETFDMTWVFRLNVNDSNTVCRVGVTADATSSSGGANGIFLEKLGADTNWFSVTRASSTNTRTDTTVATGTGWVKVRIRRIDASTIGFTVNGGTEITHTTNIPTAAVMLFTHIGNNNNASQKTMDIDFVSLSITGLSR